MIAIQKPPAPFFATPLLRPTHSRYPSAPVVVRPTQTPGLLSLSKPAAHTVPRPPVAHQQQQRQPRTSPRSKPQQRSSQTLHAHAQPHDDAKKSEPTPKADAPTEKAKIQPAASATLDKSPRGRQANKRSKDKGQRRSASSSSPAPAPAPARRSRHQPSPPPFARIPSQAEASSEHFQSPKSTDSTEDVNDPFVDEPANKVGAKGPSFRPLPPLSQPSGRLAARRQLAQRASASPSANKTVSRKERVAALVGSVTNTSEESIPESHSETPARRSKSRRVPPERDSFPVCDDSADQADDSDDTPPTTPMRETASVPFKRSSTLWHVADTFDNVPRTAPLSSTFEFPFHPEPQATPCPPHRRRNHRRIPSEGVFQMSMDEDSSSSSSSELFASTGRPAATVSRRKIPAEFRHPRASTPDGSASSPALQAGFFAGSMFQNSPSPDELPPPSF